MSDDQNIDINVNTLVDRDSLDQLKGDLDDLESKTVDVPVDTDGLDELSNESEQAEENVGGLNDELDQTDEGGAEEASNDVDQIGSSAVVATGSVTDLTDVLGLIGSAVAVGGVVAGIESIASSAGNVNDQIEAMTINFRLVNQSKLDAANSSINTLSDNTGVAKSDIRDMDNALGLVGVSSVQAANGVIKTAASISFLKTGTNDITESITQMMTRSVTSGKMMDRTFATNGISLDQMAQRSGHTEAQMKTLFAAMTPDQRANFLSEYAVDAGKAETANEDLKTSFDAVKDRFVNKIGALGTAFGQMVLPVLIPGITIVTNAISGITGVMNGLPDWAKVAGGVGILSAAFVIIGLVLMTTVIPAVSSAILSLFGLFAAQGTTLISTNGLTGALTTSFAAFVSYVTGTKLADAATLSFTAALWDMLTAMVTNPIFLIAIAIIAIAVAIEQLGVYMGWWKNWGTMVDAFKAGITRLWDAFINNKGVQATMKWLQTAWQSLMTFLGPVFAAITSWWNNLFPPQPGTFDIIQLLINFFGYLGGAIGAVVGFIQANWPVIVVIIGLLTGPIGLIIAALTLLYTHWGQIVGWFQSGASQIQGFITGLSNAWNSFASGVTSAYNTYIKPVLDAIQAGVSIAEAWWNAATGGGSGGGSASGGVMSAAGGVASGGDLPPISYPSRNHYEINLNGLVTEQSQIDALMILIQKGQNQDDMRT
jgi:hypothetical protein